VSSQTFATDPVCGMRVDPTHAPDTRPHRGATYYFCSTWCARKFDDDADAYIAAARLRDESDAEDAEDPHP
jgi:P-type Cu+ transporter